MNNEDKILTLINNDMKGKGSVKDWIKKHKRALTIAGSVLAGMLGTTAAVAIASHRGKNEFTPAEEKLAREIGLYADLPVRSVPEPKTPATTPPMTPSTRSRALSLEGKRPIDILSKPFPARRTLTKQEQRSMGFGSCGCGKKSKEIMEFLGGYQVAPYLVKYPKVGSGLIDDLIHKGITKGFNFVGNVGLNLLIETIVKIVGEPYRKVINKLIKKYGWKSISLIKKYAHKGINFITEKVDEKFGGMCCNQCKDFLDNEFRCGNIDSLEKFGSGWQEDLANGITWFNKSVVAPAARIIPGSLGEALAYTPENLDKYMSIGSDWKYQNPFEDEGTYLQSYSGARSKAPKTKKGNGFQKPDPQYEKDTFREIMSLIPAKAIGKVIGEKLGNPHWNMFGGKKKLAKYADELEGIMKFIPIDLLKMIFWEIVKGPPEVSILPKRFLHDRDMKSIWGDGKSGGTKMLPKPEYTDKEKEMMILPEPEPEMTILPYPFPHGRPQDFTKPFLEKPKYWTQPGGKPYKNPFDKGFFGKRGKKGGENLINAKKVNTYLPLMDTAPEHMDYSGSGDYKSLQDPNFNTNKLIIGKSDNKDYKSYNKGMITKSQGEIIAGGKKRIHTKKAIKNKLKF